MLGATRVHTGAPAQDTPLLTDKQRALLELLSRQFQQMIISGALVLVAQDFHGMDDEPEVQRSFGIVRTDVGVGALDRLAKGFPEIAGVVTGKRSKQIIKRRHDSAARRGFAMAPLANGSV